MPTISLRHPISRKLASKVVMPRWADIHKRLTEQVRLKDLVAQSEIDDGLTTYAGPPIGFAAMTITHSNYDTGEAMCITLGTLEAPRPVFAVLCFAPDCLICRPCLECCPHIPEMCPAVPESPPLSPISSVGW
ncbi:hypothetical protein B0A54_04679 [Friedmanniomyces endolithicus]|uniref:Uncharacterized protein n=1 Tax=Friedmanniomyces endolithicus TaxID=329885 RepID=A0A4U0V7D6_9PEZI|nr:hypothetical protein B0A54_04679 [Friedmanniomyces endolithicus]